MIIYAKKHSVYQKLDVYSLPAEVLCINEVLLAGKVPYEIGDAMERTITRKNKFVYWHQQTSHAVGRRALSVRFMDRFKTAHQTPQVGRISR